MVPVVACPLQVGGPKVGRAWGNPKRSTNVAVDRQWPPSVSPARLFSDSESSDEFIERELMRVSIYPKEGGQAKLNSLKGPRNTPKHLTVWGRENLFHLPGPFLSSALRGFTSVVKRQDRQGNAELNEHLST